MYIYALLAVVVSLVIPATVKAQVLELETQGPDVPTNGSAVAMETETNIDINPQEALPENGTVTIPTAGADDLGINEFPLPGVKVVIESDKITVTNKEVTIQ